MNKFIFIALSLLLAICSHGQTTISPTTWTGHGASVTGVSAFTSLPATTTPGASRVAVSQWDRAGSITYNTAGSSYNSNNWTTGSSLSAAQAVSSYVFFTVTNNATTELEITDVDISTQVSATGPGTMQLMYAIGSGSDATYGSAYSGYGRVTTITYSSSNTIHLCAGQTVKFKLYGWGAGGSAGTLRINNSTAITARYVDAVTAIASSTSSCSSGITLSGTDSGGVSGYSYSWSGPSGFTSTVASPSTATASGVYTLVVTDGYACADTTTVTVSGGGSGTSFPLTITPANDSLCSTAGGTTITATGAGTGGTYSWSPATGLSATTGSTVTANPSTSTTYRVSGTTSAGCTATDSVRITIFRSPSAIGGPTTVCVGATITLSDSVTAGRWSSAAAGTATVDSISGVVTGISAGTVNITYTTTGGCFRFVTITVNPLPNAGTIRGARTTVCVGDTLLLSTTGAGGSWSSQTPSVASVSATGIVTGVAAGTDSVFYTASNSCGTAKAGYSITVLPLPVAGTLSGRNRVCLFDTVLVTASVTGGVFSSSNTTVASVSASGLVTTRSSGTTNINYTVTNTCGIAVATKTLTVLPQPIVAVTPAAPQYCIGNTVNLNASGASTYSWAVATTLSGSTGANVTASPVATTTYTVIGTDANTCKDTAIVTVTVNPQPTITIPDITICKGFSGVLSASGALAYSWSPAATLSSAAGATVTAFPVDTTVYTVIGTDASGCADTVTVRVNVNKIPPPPGVVSPDTLCQNEVAAPLSASGTSLLWYTSPIPGTGVATPPLPVTTATGDFTWLVSQTVDGCESPLQPLVVRILVNAHTSFSYTIKYGCNGDTISFANTSINSDSYTWHFGDDLFVTSSETNPIHTYPTVRIPTTFTVQLNGYNNICFDDSTIMNIVLQPTPHILNMLVTPEQTIAIGGSVQLEAAGAVLYHWTPNDGSLSDPNINNPLATPQESTLYTVYGYDNNGCYDTATVKVNVIHDDGTVISSAFTPNKDGRNDEFRVIALKTGQLVEMDVYNRWGERVFTSNTLEMGWDGTYNGEPQDMGVYNYVIITTASDGVNVTHKGTVTLIR